MSTGHFGSRYLKGQSFEEKLDFDTLIFNHGVFSAAFAPLCCGGCLQAFFGMLLGAIEAVEAGELLHRAEDGAADFLLANEVPMSELSATLRANTQDLQDAINRLSISEDTTMDTKEAAMPETEEVEWTAQAWDSPPRLRTGCPRPRVLSQGRRSCGRRPILRCSCQ